MRTSTATLLTVAALCLPSFAAALPQQKPLTLQELAQRRELWPNRVAIARAFDFGGGERLSPGNEVGLLDLGGANVVLDTGKFQFECPATDTDVLARAQALVASLTPEQLALNWTSLREKSELWPLGVKLTVPIQLTDGTLIGDEGDLALRGFEGEMISVVDRKTGSYFTVQPHETDLIARARERMKLPAAELEPFFVRAVEASLVKTDGEHPLAGVDTMLFYRARLGCSRCEAFAPELKKFYERMKKDHPRFELVVVSVDGNAEDARAYLEKSKLPGRVIAFDKRREAAHAMSLSCQLLPGLHVLDRAGNVLEQNHPNGGAPNANDVLAKLEQRLVAAEKTAR